MTRFFRRLRHRIFALFFSVPIGVLAGVICFAFSKVLSLLNDFRVQNPFLTIPFLPVAGILIVFSLKKLNGKNGENGLNQGMKRVFDVARHENTRLPFRLALFVCSSTWLTNLCGGSSGREGVAVQIGACVSVIVVSFLARDSDLNGAEKIFVLSGMAAGFSAMFQTPIAAIFFALEVMTVGKIEYSAFPCVALSSFIAYFVARFLGLRREAFAIPPVEFDAANFPFLFKVLISCFVFSIVGAFFANFLEKLKEIYAKKTTNKYRGIFVSAIFLAALFLAFGKGRYSGTGANLIADAVSGVSFPLDFLLKFCLTILTLSIGFQGGEVTPLFAIGATLGAFLARVFNIDSGLFVSLGYITVFASATNTFFCPLFIAAEIFGFENMNFYIFACFVSRFLNFNQSIYDQRKII